MDTHRGGQPRFGGMRARGFSLTELLVVMGIILLVCTILLSGALAARKAARQTLCLTNLHSIGLAVTNAMRCALIRARCLWVHGRTCLAV